MLIRKATMADVEEIHKLINYWADKGLMLARSRSMLYEGLRDITLVEEDGVILGAGSLHILWQDTAEIRALTVRDEARGRGVGRAIVEACLAEAASLRIAKIIVLTYQEEFFKRCGFKVVQKEEMPHKLWKECIDCPKFPNCDEIAMMRVLTFDED